MFLRMSTQQKSITRTLKLIPHVLGQTMSALILDSFPLALPKDVVMWLAHNRGHGKTDFKRPILTLRVAFMSRLRAAFLRHKRKIGAKQGKSCRIPEARNAT